MKKFTRGAVAGAAGTTALNAVGYADMAMRGRPASSVPARVAEQLARRVGGIIPGYETARHLGLPAIFTERVDGKFQLRRNFSVAPGEKVIVVEDIVSTGLSIRECVDCMKAIGANVVAAACIIDRSAGEADIGVPLVSLTQYKVPAYPADALPPELAALPAVKPGSRGLQ